MAFFKKKNDTEDTAKKKKGPLYSLKRRYYKTFNSKSTAGRILGAGALVLAPAVIAIEVIDKDPSKERGPEATERLEQYKSELNDIHKKIPSVEFNFKVYEGTLFTVAYTKRDIPPISDEDAKKIEELYTPFSRLAERIILDDQLSEQDKRDIAVYYHRDLDMNEAFVSTTGNEIMKVMRLHPAHIHEEFKELKSENIKVNPNTLAKETASASTTETWLNFIVIWGLLMGSLEKRRDRILKKNSRKDDELTLSETIEDIQNMIKPKSPPGSAPPPKP